ncbi:MAG: auxin-regulated protein [Candidatus Dadabacteria bacterium]|nr:MAG: auxin-regulated protein [Candidatus Dadabacteria bacterium]
MFDATPLLRVYARLRSEGLKRQNYVEAQEKLLFTLLKRAENTEFGRHYDFPSIKSVSEYQKRVPLRTYDDFWNEWWKDKFPRLKNVTWPGLIKRFVISSGTTTGITKYIPFTPGILRANTKAGLDLFTFHLTNRPKSRILGGKNFMLLGSAQVTEEAPGVTSADLSDTMIQNLPFWARLYYFPRGKLYGIKDWEERINTLAPAALKEDIRLFSGVPSWMLVFINKLKEIRPESGGRLKQLFPNLEMLVHGGVKFDPYKKVFSEMLEGSRAELREVYPASEGFIAIQDRGHGEGLRLLMDHNVFYEFVPLEELRSDNPTRHTVKEIEPGINYAVVMTTAAGLWSYVIGDTVKFVETTPPRLIVTGRTSYMLSAFGEHVIEEELQKALSSVAAELNNNITDFSAGALYPSDSSELGRHIFIIEFSRPLQSEDDLKEAASIIDRELKKLNDDYQAHRADGYGMDSPVLVQAAPGAFAAWMKKRGKAGGQNKVPRVINSQELLSDLLSFVEKYNSRHDGR